MEEERRLSNAPSDKQRLINNDSPCLLQRLCWMMCKSKDDLCVGAVVICMAVGLALMCIGYIIPRDYVFDASLPARQMEAIEIRYSKLAYRLDLCIIVGMGFISLGAVITTVLTIYIYLTGGHIIYKSHDKRDLTLLNDNNLSMTRYGSSN